MDGSRKGFLKTRQAAGWARLALVAAAPLALGSFHPWVVAIESVACAAILLITVLPGHRTSSWDRLHTLPWSVVVLVGCAAVTALQLVPLPPFAGFLSIEGRAVWDGALALADPSASGWHPVTLDPPGTGIELLRIIGLASFVAAQVIAARREGTRAVRRILWVLAATGMASVVLHAAAWATGSSELLWFYTSHQARRLDPVFLATFVNPNQQASFMGLAALSALTLTVNKGHRGERFVAALCFVACSSGLVLTVSKGAWIAYGIGVISILLARAIQDRRAGTQSRSYLLASVSALLALAVAVGYTGYETVRGEWEIVRAGGPGGRPEARTDLIRAASGLMADHPVLGVGRGAFESAFPRYNDTAPEEFFHHLENEPVEAVTEWGVVAGVLLLVLFATAFLASSRRVASDPLAIGPIAALAALGLHALVDFGLRGNGIALPAAALLACVVSGVREGVGRAHQPGIGGVRLKRRALAMAAGAMLLACAFLASRPWGPTLAEDTVMLRQKAADGSLTVADGASAVIRHPAAYLPPLVVGEDHLHRGQTAEADRWIERAVVLAPHDLRVQVVRIRTALFAADYEKARAIMARLATVFDTGEVLRRVFADQAIRSRMVALAPVPDRDRALTLALVDFFDQHKRADLSLKTLERAVAALPDDPVLSERLGRQYVAAGNAEAAEAVVTRLIATHPDMPGVYDLWGLVLHRQGRHLEAYHLFLEAARRMPENCDPLFHAAQALLDTKTTDGSADLLARLAGLCPDSHSRWRTAVLRSLFAEIAGRYKEAIDAMQDADRLRPGMVETMRRIANLYEASGDMSGATFALRKLLSGFPDDRAARAQLERISRWGPGKRP